MKRTNELSSTDMKQMAIIAIILIVICIIILFPAIKSSLKPVPSPTPIPPTKTPLSIIQIQDIHVLCVTTIPSGNTVSPLVSLQPIISKQLPDLTIIDGKTNENCDTFLTINFTTSYESGQYQVISGDLSNLKISYENCVTELIVTADFYLTKPGYKQRGLIDEEGSSTAGNCPGYDDYDDTNHYNAVWSAVWHGLQKLGFTPRNSQ